MKILLINTYLLLKLVESAKIADATYVDVCADQNIIKYIKNVSDKIICVSITDLKNIDNIIVAGADLIEIGNFDHLYKQGFYITDNEILDITNEIRSRYPEIPLCVTIPHTLAIEKQILLAKKLQGLNIDLIQTEGKTAPEYSKNLLLNVSRAFASLTATYILSQVVPVPIISASNLSELTSSMAIYYGASGIGIGKSIMKYSQLDEMVQKINLLKQGLSSNCYKINKINHISIFNILNIPENKLYVAQ